MLQVGLVQHSANIAARIDLTSQDQSSLAALLEKNYESSGSVDLITEAETLCGFFGPGPLFSL